MTVDLFNVPIIVLVEQDKMGDPNNVNNYRPVSLVTIFLKKFKLCLSKQLMLGKYVDPPPFYFVKERVVRRSVVTELHNQLFYKG